MASRKMILDQLQSIVSPEVFAKVSSQIGRGEEVMDNQNQNQGSEEEFAQLKPELLREITIGVNLPTGEEVMDNQNQNQGKLADLMKLKPNVLRQLRQSLRGEEVMDNQNQNQGSTAEPSLEAKPRLSESTKD